MKNFPKTILCLGLSLLTVGAIAQTKNYASFTPTNAPGKFHMIVKSVKNSHHAGTHRVTSIAQGYLDYVDGDLNNMHYTFYNGTSGNYTDWDPVLYMNSRYTIADTVYSPLSSALANQYTTNSCSVAFDTLWDNYAFVNSGVGFIQPQAGSVVVDTIWTELGYHNTSGQNDTLIFTFCAVTAGGFPTSSPVYAADTEIIAPHSTILPGTSMDSTYVIGFIPTAPISIPSSAVGGWHFCVNATVNASKSDTLGVTYYSAFTICGGGGYTDSTSSMGPVNGTTASGAPEHTNSFVTGLYWFNAAEFGGTGAQETFPSSTTYPGLWVNSGGEEFFGFTPCTSTPSFVWYPYIQNITILLSIEYNNVVTGTNQIAASGLSVGQNYPNPFNKETQITYSLTKSSDVTFSVYDMTGRVLINNVYTNSAPGQHTINLSANSFSPGVYFYTFNVNGNKVTNKMVITE